MIRNEIVKLKVKIKIFLKNNWTESVKKLWNRLKCSLIRIRSHCITNEFIVVKIAFQFQHITFKLVLFFLQNWISVHFVCCKCSGSTNLMDWYSVTWVVRPLVQYHSRNYSRNFYIANHSTVGCGWLVISFCCNEFIHGMRCSNLSNFCHSLLSSSSDVITLIKFFQSAHNLLLIFVFIL